MIAMNLENYGAYTIRSSLEPIVARAIVIGLLSEEEVGSPIIKLLKEQITFFQGDNHKINAASIKNKKSAA